MEKERIQPARNSRTLQQRSAGSANIMDNRPDGSRNYLSGHPLQRVEDDDEDVLQGKLSTPAQRVESEEDDDEVLQGKMAEPVPKNETGLPDNLKAGVESLSGYSLDDVRVHYNSSKPATVQALAYTQGTDIHVAPGQEKHLPHEAWHVAQQMAGRVSPTTNINGMPVNDNVALEHEADVMGEKALMQVNGGCIVQHKKDENKVAQMVSVKVPIVDNTGDGEVYPNTIQDWLTLINNPAIISVLYTDINVVRGLFADYVGRADLGSKSLFDEAPRHLDFKLLSDRLKSLYVAEKTPIGETIRTQISATGLTVNKRAIEKVIGGDWKYTAKDGETLIYHCSSGVPEKVRDYTTVFFSLQDLYAIASHEKEIGGHPTYKIEWAKSGQGLFTVDKKVML